MKIVILCAMDKELELLTSLVDNPNNTDFGFICGEVGDNYVYIGKCGIGKVNAAVQTYRVIEKFEPDLIINSGVAGGTRCFPPGTVVIPDGVVYHDVWCGPGTEYGYADGTSGIFTPSEIVIRKRLFDGIIPLRGGLICTGDKFISTKEEIDFINSKFPDVVVAVDMESAAIAQVCEMMNVPFGIIRILSDTPGVVDDNYSQYENFWNEAPSVLFKVVKTILNDIKK